MSRVYVSGQCLPVISRVITWSGSQLTRCCVVAVTRRVVCGGVCGGGVW